MHAVAQREGEALDVLDAGYPATATYLMSVQNRRRGPAAGAVAPGSTTCVPPGDKLLSETCGSSKPMLDTGEAGRRQRTPDRTSATTTP